METTDKLAQDGHDASGVKRYKETDRVSDVLGLWSRAQYRNTLSDAQIYELGELCVLTATQFVEKTGATRYCLNWFRRELSRKGIKHKLGRLTRYESQRVRHAR